MGEPSERPAPRSVEQVYLAAILEELEKLTGELERLTVLVAQLRPAESLTPRREGAEGEAKKRRKREA